MKFSWKKSIDDQHLLSLFVWVVCIVLCARAFLGKTNEICLLLIRYASLLGKAIKSSMPTSSVGMFIFFILTRKNQEKIACDTMSYLSIKSI
ncbi:hypothetical protein [Myroides sp. C20-1]|uniref:hypothetical protein n=1 Tax=Myroides sp. C20-1 TaxID=3400534 RepID=UPI003D2F54DB